MKYNKYTSQLLTELGDVYRTYYPPAYVFSGSWSIYFHGAIWGYTEVFIPTKEPTKLEAPYIYRITLTQLRILFPCHTDRILGRHLIKNERNI